MNLLCPNCQRMLTVSEQFAGQLMKCPLCTGTFTVPNLPQAPGAAPSGPPVSQPLPATASGDFMHAATLLTPAPSAIAVPRKESEGYGLAEAGGLPPMPPPPLPNKEPPAMPPLDNKPATRSAAPPPLPPASPAMGGHLHARSICLDPRYVIWVAPGALALILLLLFAPWVATSLSEKESFTQSGCGTGFGSWWSFAGTLHVLLLLVATFLAMGAAAVPLLSLSLPPVVKRYWPYRTVIVSAGVLFVSLLFAVELTTGFGMESVVERQPEAGAQAESKPAAGDLAASLKGKEAEIARLTLRRTAWLKLVILLHLVALCGVGLQYALEQRGTRPLPRLEFRW